MTQLVVHPFTIYTGISFGLRGCSLSQIISLYVNNNQIFIAQSIIAT